MRRRERERQPFLLGYAAPGKLWRSAYIIGLAIGIVGAELGAPWWLFLVTAFGGAGLVDVWWRGTHLPSTDAKWSWLARALYTRSRSDSDA